MKNIEQKSLNKIKPKNFSPYKIFFMGSGVTLFLMLVLILVAFKFMPLRETLNKPGFIRDSLYSTEISHLVKEMEGFKKQNLYHQDLYQELNAKIHSHLLQNISSKVMKTLQKKFSKDLTLSFLFNKLEREVESGAPFRDRLKEVLNLLPSSTQETFEIKELLQYSVKGIPTLYSLEEQLREDKSTQILPPSKNKFENLYDFFKSLVKVQPSTSNPELAYLLKLIKKNNLPKAYRIAEQHFPEKKEWLSELQLRINCLDYLQTLERLILNMILEE